MSVSKSGNRQGGRKTGETVITTSGNLPVKYIIHTLGPIWHVATWENGVKTIDFSNINTAPIRRITIFTLNCPENNDEFGG